MAVEHEAGYRDAWKRGEGRDCAACKVGAAAWRGCCVSLAASRRSGAGIPLVHALTVLVAGPLKGVASGVCRASSFSAAELYSLRTTY